MAATDVPRTQLPNWWQEEVYESTVAAGGKSQFRAGTFALGLRIFSPIAFAAT